MISNEAKRVLGFLRSSSAAEKSLEEARENAKNMRSVVKFPEGIEKVNVNADNVKCELFVPVDAEEDKVIIYFHGGGYCLGIEDNNRNFAAKIAQKSGYKLLLIDYRLAPENKYPAAHEDALSVYMWAVKKYYKPENIVFMGDSSGCGLLIATLLKIKEKGLSMPRASVCISPVVDYTKTAQSLTSKKELDPYKYDDPFSIADNFLEDNDVKNPFISPLYGDLSNLPPILIHGSEYDVFLDDSVNLAKTAQEYGVNVSLKIYEGLWHVFHVTSDIVPEAKEALSEICNFIDKNFK